MSIEAMLEQLVPEPDGFGNWDDVLARAGIEKRRRIAITAVVVAALLAILFATPAFGLLLDLIGRTNVSFSGGRTAPTRVQRNFFDMSLAAPQGMGPHAIASETRRVGTLHGRALYVAPTRGGGFCWEIERSVGGCADKRSRSRPLSLGWGMIERRGGPVLVRDIYGEVYAPTARSLTVEYRDGTSRHIGFIWVTKPIDAGFFTFPVPKAHQRGASAVTAVVLRDAHDKVLARARVFTHRVHVPTHTVTVPRSYRPPPPPLPKPPFQHGSANGVSVVIGANGIAEFHVTNPQLRKAAWACFKFMQYHQVDPFELGYEPQTIRGNRIQMGNVRGPFDGCEVRPEWGHPWPDPHGYHSGAEIAFTARARRYFADRAAARELVLYFRWSRHHANAPTTGITVTRSGGNTTYSVRSTTGKRFAITVRAGKVLRENVTPLARPLY